MRDRCHLLHRGDHFTMHSICRLGACRYCLRGRRVRKSAEPRGGYLRPSGVVYAGEENSLHTRALSVCGCGTSTCPAVEGKFGASQRNTNVAVNAPAICATTNSGTSTGLMPVNVFVNERASVTAGFANEVEEVNQYAAVM